MRIGSLFSGIGGLELGLEWAGLGPVAWQVEIDPFCRSVLERHWPNATRFDDVRTVGAHNLGAVDLICGGFPCQDVSTAGKGAGLDGARSGLWFEYARIIREIRPRYVVAENVAALAGRGLDRVLGELAASGYDAIWIPVRAADVGAPHRRERIFIVAYRDGGRREGDDERDERGPQCDASRGHDADGHRAIGFGGIVGDPDLPRLEGRSVRRRECADERATREAGGAAMADAASIGEREPHDEAGTVARNKPRARAGGRGAARMEHAPRIERAPMSTGESPRQADARHAQSRVGGVPDGISAGLNRWPARPGEAQHEWEPPRVATGIDNRPARLRALGNAVVPQVGYVIGCVVRDMAMTMPASTGTGRE